MASSRIGVCVHGVALNTWCERCPSGKRYQITVSGATASNTQEAPEPTQAAHAGEPRAIVRAFALAMERKLAANDATKGGWKQDSPFDLLRRLREEASELVDAVNDLTHVHMGQSQRTIPETTTAILLEAADVANFALFVADVCGALPPTDERGR